MSQKESDCPFCEPREHADQHIIFEDARVRYLRQPQEVLLGAGVIVPRAHRETVFDLTKAEWRATFGMLKRAKAELEGQYDVDGFTVGWNCYEAAGQKIPHAHLHVIPRFEEDPNEGIGIRDQIKEGPGVVD